MGRLIYVTPASLDGFIGDGDYSWSAPYAEEVMSVLTAGLADVGTYLYGRRTYETMAVWETDPALAAASELRAEFANVWQRSDKIVHSTTLPAVSTARTRLERRFDADAVRTLKETATDVMTVGGADFAAQVFDAGLVDECHLFVCPVVVGAGKPAFAGNAPEQLDLQDERRFDNGEVYLRYRVQPR